MKIYLPPYDPNDFVTYFLIGIWDLRTGEDEWPWHFHYEYGQYLSAKKRKCKLQRAAKFDTKEEALNFFDSWVSSYSHGQFFRCEILECQKRK
ncbi:MAG: hypothetical protein ACTH6I_10340 [Vibrio litoralis]|uniref:hypothetical protein n=1 Tax=Vibrio litoralis TaxID=335972 RepID=UPI003F99506F